MTGDCGCQGALMELVAQTDQFPAEFPFESLDACEARLGEEDVEDPKAMCMAWAQEAGVHDEAMHDHVALTDATVEREGDWIVIPDTVVMKEGVHNDVLRPADELEKSFELLEGVPVTMGHPPQEFPREAGLVAALEEVHGLLREPRWDEDDSRILADVALAATVDVEGLEVDEDIVEMNLEIATAIENGAQIDGSPGSLFTGTGDAGTFEGEPHGDSARNISWTHYAFVDQGACSWQDGCGIARAQQDSTSHDSRSAARKLLDRFKQSLSRTPEGGTMEGNEDDDPDPEDPEEPGVSEEEEEEGAQDEEEDALLDQIRGVVQEEVQPLQESVEELNGRVSALEETDEAELDEMRETLAEVRDHDVERYEDYSADQLETELEAELDRARTKQPSRAEASGFQPASPHPLEGEDGEDEDDPVRRNRDGSLTVTDLEEI